MKTKPYLIVFTLFLTLSACTTSDPYTGEQRVRKSVKYGAAGAVVCGLIGATRNSKSARNAALGCGAIGAGIGAYMDHQEAELRRELAGTGVRVYRDGDQIQLIMPGNITFNTDEYAIKSSFYPVLNSVAKVLYKYEDTQLEIIGHTDSVGESQYNQRLSKDRAYSVADYLANQNVSGRRLRPYGEGENQPIASNSTDSGRAQNRRVELYITADPS
ncbi:OmpA family protein [Marinicella sp. W31]|uniref:OmpA family protein n=1 Tax=Marinicella sp. W31 TaxID=3023713 RepID=UPI003757FEC8